MFDDERDEEREEGAAAEPEAAAEPAAGEQAGDEQPAEEAGAEAAAGQEGEPEAAAEGDAEAAEQRAEQKERQRRERKRKGKAAEEEEPEVIPGAHLEPDLVLEDRRKQEEEPEFGRYQAQEVEAESQTEPEEGEEEPTAEPVRAPSVDLAADARYRATGKRKTAVARVILKPGDGTYSINGKPLDVYFPRETLQVQIRQPLDVVGYSSKMDVVAKIHGGGIAAQAGALRHGIARALVEADPNLRGEMKRRGFLTRDARVKERKKAGLKKARKRPQFSKR